MGVPKSFPPVGGLLCPGGVPTSFPLPCGRGWLMTIIVVKTEGPDCHFDVQFYNAETGARGESVSDSEQGGAVIPPECYELGFSLSSEGFSPAGNVIKWFQPGGGYPFSSLDRDARGERGGGKIIWMKITPLGVTADVTFAVALTMDLYQ